MVAYGQTTQLFSTPYLTLAEYKNAPTGVQTDNLVPGASATQNDIELANLIARASSQIDTYCQQVIAATVDTWQTRARVGRDGMLRLRTRYFPIRSVTALSFGASPDAMSTVALDATVWVEERRVIVPAALIGNAVSTSSPFPRMSTYGRPVLVQVTYVNGYPNTTLTAAVAAASSLPLADVTGVLPGDHLGIYDEANGTQTVVVASTWTPTTGAGSVPITTSVTAGVNVAVSALPPAVKQAAIHVVTGILKSKGAGSLTMTLNTSPSGARVNKDGGAQFEFTAAQDLLHNFIRVV